VVSLFEQFRLLHPGWRDVLQVAIVAFVIYRVLLLVHRTRALQVLVGLLLLVVSYGIAYVLQLNVITYLLTLVSGYGVIALIVVFAPEIRAALAQLGRSRWFSHLFGRLKEAEVGDEVSEAVDRLSRTGVGAIIAIERENSLDEFVHSGSEMQAKVSADLLATIFTPYSPLHDGAVIIRGDTIVGAACILPLSQTSMIDRSLGTRHRAALGLAEETDALVFVVSEQTAAIAVASGGRLWRDFSARQIRDLVAGRPLREVALEAGVAVPS
jgi:diadenylate cyclase